MAVCDYWLAKEHGNQFFYYLDAQSLKCSQCHTDMCKYGLVDKAPDTDIYTGQGYYETPSSK